jgi:hypothetical protein
MLGLLDDPRMHVSFRVLERQCLSLNDRVDVISEALREDMAEAKTMVEGKHLVH